MSSTLRNPDEYQFPDCVTACIAVAISAIEGVTNIEYRGISSDDPSGTVGFDVTDWVAGEEEMAGHTAGLIPSEATHSVSIEYLNKDSDSARGEELHRRITREIRTMLYADAELAVALGQLSRTGDNIIERMLRWKAIRQQNGSNKINGAFVSMSATEFMFITEMVPA